MSFLNTFTMLCNEMSKAPSAVCVELGLSNAIYTYWKRHGAVPRPAMLKKIADYFHVSVAYLLGETDDRTPTDSHSATKPAETGNKLSGVEFALYGEIQALSEEERLDVLDYIRFKKQQKEKRQ